jgi:guanine deaminase
LHGYDFIGIVPHGIFMCNEEFMKAAISKAREGIEHGQTPFGACIVKNGKIISCEHNRVWEITDITAHAEIVAIREACSKQGSVDLSGCEIYTTTEPCPMCFSAIHWARIGKVIFGTGIEDAVNVGFNEITVSNEDMIRIGKSPVTVEGGFLYDENLALFREFSKRPGKKVY